MHGVTEIDELAVFPIFVRFRNKVDVVAFLRQHPVLDF